MDGTSGYAGHDPESNQAEFTVDAVVAQDMQSFVEERVLLTGAQALAHLTRLQMQRDRQAGWQTATFVAGYRGTALHGIEQAFASAEEELAGLGVRFRPAINEELAATAVLGSQQAMLSPRASCQGVVGIWYGTGSGIGRCGEILRQAGAAGSAALGGALCLCIDDGVGQGLSLPEQSIPALVNAGLPVLQPVSLADLVPLSLAGIAMSRFSGCWTGVRATRHVMNALVSLSPEQVPHRFKLPDGVVSMPGGRGIRLPMDAAAEPSTRQRLRLDAARAFALANGIDLSSWRDVKSRLGIVAGAESVERVRQAMQHLSLDESLCRDMGVALYQVRMPWPLDPEGMNRFADGLEKLLVIEDAPSLIMPQLARLLYHCPDERRPILVDCNEELARSGVGDPLPSADTELTEWLARQLLCLSLPDGVSTRIESALAKFRWRIQQRAGRLPPVVREARFCAGCSHNRSTRVPEGSVAMAGNGCHQLVQRMDRRSPIGSPMGGEGVGWIGIETHTDETHRFANLGDGTWTHSGLLAVRAAVAAGINITYRILCNDVAALAGGESAVKPLDPVSIVQQLQAEGVTAIHVIVDDAHRCARSRFPAGVELRPRAALEQSQQTLRSMPGCSAIVHVQTCAAAARRSQCRSGDDVTRRRVFINADICDGCGACSRHSNCVAIEPLETAMGRKRRIEQSLCSADLSCLEVACPAIVTVEGGQSVQPSTGKPRESYDDEPIPVPDTRLAVGGTWNIMLQGMAGDAVDELTRVLGLAAHLDSKRAHGRCDEETAPRGEPITGQIRIARAITPDSATVADGEADLVLAVDAVTAISGEALDACDQRRTETVLNRSIVPLTAFITDPDVDCRQQDLEARVAKVSRSAVHFHAFGEAAMERLGDRQHTACLMLGYAWQQGLVPIGLDALQRALTEIASSATAGVTAFQWGRRLAMQPSLFPGKVGSEQDEGSVEQSRREVAAVEKLIGQRAAYLAGYQDEALAERYRRRVDPFVRRCRELGVDEALPRLVATEYARLLAVRDEYEIARLHCQPGFRQALEQAFGKDHRVRFHFVLPVMGARSTGKPLRVRSFGSWILRVLSVLQHGRRWRGTRWDLAGRSPGRQADHHWISLYEQDMALVQERLNRDNVERALLLLGASCGIRGFGDVRRQAMSRAATIRQAALSKFDGSEGAAVQRAA